MESIQEKLFPSNRFRLVALSPDAKEERRTVQLIREHYTSPYKYLKTQQFTPLNPKNSNQTRRAPICNRSPV